MRNGTLHAVRVRRQATRVYVTAQLPTSCSVLRPHHWLRWGGSLGLDCYSFCMPGVSRLAVGCAAVEIDTNHSSMHWPCAVGLAAPPLHPAASVASIQVAPGGFDCYSVAAVSQQSVVACSSEAAVSFFSQVSPPDAVDNGGLGGRCHMSVAMCVGLYVCVRECWRWRWLLCVLELSACIILFRHGLGIC